jgi:hypothetical protein
MGKYSLKHIIHNNLAVTYTTEQIKTIVPVSNNFIVDNSKDKPLK